MKNVTRRLQTEDRLLLWRRFALVLALSIPIGGITLWMLLGTMADEASLPVRLGFLAFFFGILLFIVVSHLRTAFDRDALLITGVVTGKQVNMVTAGYSNTGSSPTWHISIDDEAHQVDQSIYNAVSTGQTVELWVSPSTQQAIRAKVISGGQTTGAPLSLPPRPAQGEGNRCDGFLSAVEQAIVRRRLLRAVFFRSLIGGSVCWLLARLTLLAMLLTVHLFVVPGTIPYLLLVIFSDALWVAIFLRLNRWTWRLWRDLRSGHKQSQIETVLDVVESSTPLARPNIVLTGTGMSGRYAYLRTHDRWLSIDPEFASRYKTGDPVLVGTTPRAGLVLSVGPANRGHLSAQCWQRR